MGHDATTWDVMPRDYNLNSREVEAGETGAQSHLQLCSECKAALGYIKKKS